MSQPNPPVRPAPPRPAASAPQAGGFMGTLVRVLPAGWKGPALMTKLAIAGWATAAGIALAAGAGYLLMKADKSAAVALLNAEMDRRTEEHQRKMKAAKALLDKARAEAEMRVQKVQSDAMATQQAIQADLDFERLPSLPARFEFRPEKLGSPVRVLSVSNERNETFRCAVKLRRLATGEEKSIPELAVNARSFRDLSVLDGWELRVGDRVEFTKPGFKPLQVELK